MKEVELEEFEVVNNSKYFSENSNESDLISKQLELVNKLTLDIQKLIQTQISEEKTKVI
jgi:hypothetical protein